MSLGEVDTALECRPVIVYDSDADFRMFWRNTGDGEIFGPPIGSDSDYDTPLPTDPEQAFAWAAHQAILKRGGQRDDRGFFWRTFEEAAAAMADAHNAAVTANAVPAWQWAAMVAGWKPSTEDNQKQATAILANAATNHLRTCGTRYRDCDPDCPKDRAEKAVSDARVAAAKAVFDELSDEEWEAARPDLCRGCLKRLEHDERCYCERDD